MSVNVVEEELLESVQGTTAELRTNSTELLQEVTDTALKVVSRTPAAVHRADIQKEFPLLSSQNVASYSKASVVWTKSRLCVNGKRSYDSCSKSICVRDAGFAVTEENSPFIIPNSLKGRADVAKSIESLNKRYMLVVKEVDNVLGQIYAAIKMSCVCRNAVCAEGLAYLMLGMECSGEDMTVLTSLLQAVDCKRLEWKLTPNAEPSISVPSVLGQLSHEGCASVERYSAFVLQHITVREGLLYDIVLQAKCEDVSERTIIPSPIESSSGWEGVSSDAATRRGFGSAIVDHKVRGMTTSSDTSEGDDTRISIPPRVPLPVVEELDMYGKMKKMLSPRMYQAVCLLQMPQKSWFVALYFAFAAVVVAMLRFALTDFQSGDGGFIFTLNFGPTLFSYAFIWNTYPKAVVVWYSLYSVLSEERRATCTAKWESRCKIGIFCSMFASFGGMVMRVIRIIVYHPEMVLNVPAFCVISGLMWLLNIVQICLVLYGFTCFVFTCRLSKYDISESKITLRNFSQFLARCAKMHKLRMVTFISFFVCICFSISIIWHAFLETFSVKFFIFLPFGVILPHVKNDLPGLGVLVWTLLLTLSYVVMFLRILYATQWPAKAKAERQVQLSGEVKEKFVASNKISGWFLSHQLVCCSVCVFWFGRDTQRRMYRVQELTTCASYCRLSLLFLS